ncbi:hypothetical protein QYM36_015129 [Artemia franciscana]|uniref:Ig-like domain-containing protein n=1 Tax=Artemia franciscana TaxID=6661 RepID=A0AA88KX42_ARTSF|nr:hypothetical protein QYM36_015129 [Artemia franciscana]KAK2707338.1 hypothetical protein QYM36_015129 [Artemia franciscana]KAK2707339.1 hypothetical protein QYM36_015129 [Artemia franciscana]
MAQNIYIDLSTYQLRCQSNGINFPTEQQAVIGKEFKVKCVVKAKAYDVLTVHWFKDGIDISES